MVAFAIFASLSVLAVALERRPVIGIYPTVAADNYLKASKEWLAQEGADSLELPESFNASELETLFQSVNGLLIPGGGRALDPSLRAMVNHAVMANRAGDFFPVWGTCLGFEWLVEIFGGTDAITDGFDANDLASNMTFTEAAKTSRVYESANPSLLQWLASEPITYNAHTEGISPESTAWGTTGLLDTFTILATEKDRNGRASVAQIEGKTLPFYANQFHPEKVQFVHGPWQPAIPRSAHAIAAARHLAQFFVNEARKNNHHNSAEFVV